MTPTQVDRMLEAARDIVETADTFELCFLDPLTVQWARDILAANRALKAPPAPDANPDW